MIDKLKRFIRHGEWVIREAERGNPEAEIWCIFVNLTAISVGAIVVVLLLWVWI